MYCENDSIVSKIYASGVLDELLKNMGVKENDFDDLKQELAIILLEYNQDKLKEMYDKKQIKFFLVRVIQFQYFSKTSPFYKKYKKYYQFLDGNTLNNEEQDEEQDNRID
jgi:bisphosphoglycerate-independent phosphoglycerate mutase (AlkP superfamily)